VSSPAILDAGDSAATAVTGRVYYMWECGETRFMSDSPPGWALHSCVPTAADLAQSDAIEENVLRLFDQFRNRLLRYVLALGLPIEEGEEVVQEVFLSLFRHLQQGRPAHNLAGWLFRVAHNLGLKRRSFNQKLRDLMAPDDDAVAQQCDTGLSPEEGIIQRQRHERLVAVLRALPEQDQLCLRLRAEGLRYRDIAQTLGISLGSVSNSLTRSLARLASADER
jgi:RNA polymerase sigma-70 factor, ECF subfamily